MGNFLASQKDDKSDLLIEFICRALFDLQNVKSQYEAILDVHFSKHIQFRTSISQQDVSKYFLNKRNAKFDNSVYSIEIDNNRCTLKTVRAVLHHMQVSKDKNLAAVEVRRLLEENIQSIKAGRLAKYATTPTSNSSIFNLTAIAEEEPTKEELQLGLFLQQFDLSLFAKFAEFTQSFNNTISNSNNVTNVTEKMKTLNLSKTEHKSKSPPKTPTRKHVTTPKITKQPPVTPIIQTEVSSPHRSTPPKDSLSPSVQKTEKQNFSLKIDTDFIPKPHQSISPVPPLGQKFNRVSRTSRQKTTRRSVSPYDFLMSVRDSTVSTRSSVSAFSLKPDKKLAVEECEDTHKINDSSEEEDNIAIEIPDTYDVSPLVSHIKTMLKVLRNLTDTNGDQPKPQTNHVILAMSYLTDLELAEESNQYAIVDSQGILPLLKLFTYKEDNNIRIGAATVLSILSRNSRIQLKIADEVGIKLLLSAITDGEIMKDDISEEQRSKLRQKARMNDDSISFQCLVCEIIANCCERVKVRKLFRKNQGLRLILQLLYYHENFYLQDDSAGSRPRSGAARSRSATILKKTTITITPMKKKKLNEEIQVIVNASKVLWKASKSKKNQELIRRQNGVETLSNLIDNIMQYMAFVVSIQNSEEAYLEPLESPTKIIVPILGTLMHCAQSSKVRAQMETTGVTDKIFKVAQAISKINEYGNDIELQTVLAGAINQLCQDETAQIKVKKFKVIGILGSWLKTYEAMPRDMKTMTLLELLTSTLWHCSSMEVNALEILDLGLIPVLVSLQRVDNSPDVSALTMDVDRSDKNVKVSSTGVMSNCAKIPECRSEMHKAGVVKSLCQLFTASASTQLLVNCLDTLGYIADTSDILKVVLEENGMRSIWTMLRSEKPPVQAAAARAICNCVNTALVAAQIGEIFISGIAALVRTLESSKDPLVIGYTCQAIAKMSLYETNRAVLSEEGALLQLAKVLQATRDQLTDLINQMGQSYAAGNLSSKNRTTNHSAQNTGNGYTLDKVDNLNLCNPILNKKLSNILFVKANASIAIGELAKRKGNRLKFYECGVIEPLVENLMIHPFLQSHHVANHGHSFDNYTMIEIVGKKGPSKNGTQQVIEHITNPRLTCVPPFACNSAVCAKDSSNGPVTVPDLDCYYSHLFRNSSYALSVLSEEKTIAMALRMCNCVALLVKLLSSRNDDLQIAAATCASNIRRYHVSLQKNNGTLLAPPSVRTTRSRTSSIMSSLSFNDTE